MGKLLIDGEPPLIVQASLALKIGFNEAMLLQQVHYWLQRSTTTAYGHRWVYNNIEEWQKQFPFWSKDTVRRAIARLKKRGLLVAECLANNSFDRMPYYRIDAETLESIVGCKLQSTEDTVDGNLQSSNMQNAIDIDGNLPASDDCNLQCSDDGNLQSTLDSTETTKEYAETKAVGPGVIVAESSAAPQAANADDAIQPGLFAEDPNPSEQQTGLKAKPQTEAEVIEGVFAYWQKTMDSPKSMLDDKRRKRIRDALKMGYSPRDLCRAIQGCSLTPHNQGKNDRGQPYLGIHVCLKDADQIDRFIANSVSPPVAQPENRAQQQSDGLDAAAAEFAARMAAKYGTPETVQGGYQVPNDGMTIDMNME